MRSWITKHQVVAFFASAIAMNFVLGIPGVLLLTLSQTVLKFIGFYLLRMAVFSPVLSGILLVRLGEPESACNGKKVCWIVFGAVALLAWAVGTLQMKITMPSGVGLSMIHLILLNGPVALLPAYVFSRAVSSSSGLRTYLGSLIRPHGHVIWYVIAFLTFPAIHILGNAITHVLGGRSLAIQGLSSHLILIAAITFLNVFLYTGGINEESGWRGFALPRLQARHSTILAALIIWACHATWELNGDVFMNLIMGGHVAWPVISRLVWMPSWTILFIWVYNRTGGSILAPAIFHSSMNMMNPLMGVLPTTNAGTVMLVIFALFAVIHDRMWKRLPVEHSAVFKTG